MVELDAKMAAEEALPPEAKRQKAVDLQAWRLVEHLKPKYARGMVSGERFLEHFPLIVFQKAPRSSRGASCKLRVCGEKIEFGDYCVALTPGMEYGNWHKSPSKQTFS